MLTKRIIACLDVKDGRVVKGINFVNLIDAGDPVEIAEYYNNVLIDELVFLDINASYENRGTMLDVVERTAARVYLPLTVGGGIRTLDDMRNTLNSGADKVSINTAAILNPDLINNAAELFGSQCVVVAIDAKKSGNNSFDVYINGGRDKINKSAVEWAKEVEERGAGEILLTSMDRDGTKAGFDVELTRIISEAVNIPVIASGGAGTCEHFLDVLTEGKADAALAASLFHFKEVDVLDLKKYLLDNNIPIRME